MALADYVLKRPPRTLPERLIFWIGRSLWKVPRENVWTAGTDRTDHDATAASTKGDDQ